MNKVLSRTVLQNHDKLHDLTKVLANAPTQLRISHRKKKIPY